MNEEQLQRRFEKVRAAVLARPKTFAGSGKVATCWRTRQGRRFGPYFRLRYWRRGQWSAIYLGPSEELARMVADLIADLRRRLEERRQLRRLMAEGRRRLRQSKRDLEAEAARWGIHMKGWKFRGWRKGLEEYTRWRAEQGQGPSST